MKIKFIALTIFVLLLAASVFAFNKTGASVTNSCPTKAQSSATTDYEHSNVVFSRSDENCCAPGADCCKGGACCKHKRK